MTASSRKIATNKTNLSFSSSSPLTATLFLSYSAVLVTVSLSLVYHSTDNYDYNRRMAIVAPQVASTAKASVSSARVIASRGVDSIKLDNGVKKAIFIRHGESLANKKHQEYIAMGKSEEEYRNLPLGDVPLTDKGITQAKTLNIKLTDKDLLSQTEKFQVWVSPMRRTIETAQNVFGDSKAKFDRISPDAREFFPRDFGKGSNCNEVSKFLGYPFYNEVWEENHESEDHINDHTRMERLHDAILAEKETDNIFVVCHWGTIQHYINRYAQNLSRNQHITEFDFLMNDGGWGALQYHNDGMVSIEEIENCAVRVIEYRTEEQQDARNGLDETLYPEF